MGGVSVLASILMLGMFFTSNAIAPVLLVFGTRIGSNRGNSQSTIMQYTQDIHTHSNRLGWCTRRAFVARWGFVLVPVHMGVCCAGGLLAGHCRLLCVVFPVLGVCAATYSVHAH